MTTARSLIQSSLVKIGSYDLGEQILDADAATGLQVLNNLIDKWAEEYLYLYTINAQSLNWPSAGTTGTIGLGGGAAFNFPRPTRLTVGPGAATITASGTTYQVDVISAIEFQAIFSVAPGPQARPSKLFYDPQFPLGVINLLPAADQNYTLVINSWLPFTKFADLSTAYVFAPGIEEAIKTNLPLSLRAYFADTPSDPEMVARAVSSKSDLKQTNMMSRAMIPTAPPVTRA